MSSFSRSGPDNPTRGDRTAHAQDELLERGATVGRYVVLERIGFGGMGIVYSAYDPELDRRVAVKLLRSRAGGSVSPVEAQQRLIREAQAMARVSHPNVVAVYDVGTVGDRVFMTMELVDGVTIGDWLRKQARTWREVLDVFVGAGRGLEAAHAAGLVHRDFKPENVLVSNSGRPVVTDFGLVRPSVGPHDDKPLAPPEERPAQDSLHSPLTQAGSVMGTPGYMSPEQQRAATVDERTDQFSFCVALYEALFKERPYPPGAFEHGKTAPPIPAPPEDSDVPQWVRKVLVGGLSVEPELRYASMSALLEALSRDPRVAWRRRIAYGAAAAVVIALLAGMRVAALKREQQCQGATQLLSGAWDAQTAQAVHAAFSGAGVPYAEAAFRSVSQALDAWSNAWAAQRVQACEATRLRHEQPEDAFALRMECLDRRLGELRALTGVLATADSQVVEKSVQAAQSLGDLRPCADVAALRAPVRAPSDPASRQRIDNARMKVAQAKSLLDAGRIDEGAAEAAVASSEAKAIGWRPLEGEAWLMEGILEERKGELEKARNTVHSALWAAIAGHDDPTAAKAAGWLVRINGYGLAKFDEAQKWFDRGLALLERAGSQPAIEADLQDALGSAMVARDDYPRAGAAFRRAVELRERELGPDHLDTIVALSHEATVLYLKGDQDEAEKRFRRAIAAKEKILGPDHPGLIPELHNLANVLTAESRYPDALAVEQRALKLSLRTFGEKHERTAQIYSELSVIDTQMGRYEQALEEAQRGAGVLEALLGSAHPKVGNAIDAIGDTLMKLKRYQEALIEYRRALTMKEKSGAADGPAAADSMIGIARALIELGRQKEALPMVQRAYAIREAKASVTEKADARFALAQALRKGDPARSTALAREAEQMFAQAGDKEDAEEVQKFLAAGR